MSRKVLSDLDFGGVARGINHPNPVNAQDVATRAFVLRPLIADYVVSAGLASSMLYTRNATYDTLGVSSIPDLLNTNPAVQSVTARKPQIGLSNNGLPILTFDGGDVLSWPLTAANNNDNTLGFAFWYRPVNVGATYERIFEITANAGGSSAHKLDISRSGSQLLLTVYFSNLNARLGFTGGVLTAGAWHFVTFEYNSAPAAEAARIVITIGTAISALGFSSIGAGGSGALATVTGAALIGAQSNETTPAGAMLAGSAIGPVMFARNSAMAGVTDGVWTPAGRTALMAIEAPLGILDDGTITNAKHFPMGAGTVLLRALGAGTGPPVEGTGAEVAAIVAPSLAGTGLGAAAGALYARPFFADFVLSTGLASALLYVRNATYDANGASSVPDLLNTNPAVQTVTASKPKIGVSANGLPILTFDGGDLLVWPLTTANNNTNTSAFACWHKPASSGGCMLFAVSGDVGSATQYKHMLVQSGNYLGVKTFFTAGSNGRNGTNSTVSLAFGQWYFITVEYCSTHATEALRSVITVNGAVLPLTFINENAGGAGPLFVAVTGNAIIGAQGTTTAGALPAGAAVGTCMYAHNVKMVGATEGVWTPAARASLMAIEAPT